MEKKQICGSDSWFRLPPTESIGFIVSVDAWFLVIYCLLLLFLKLFSYFILRDGCERKKKQPKNKKPLSFLLKLFYVLTYQ